MWKFLWVFGTLTLASCASMPPSEATARTKAAAASQTLMDKIGSVSGCLGVKSAHGHDGTELIFAWFENKAAVLNWFEHPYHRKLLRDAGRPEDHRAAELMDEKIGPILVIASVAYPAKRGALDASMFDDPVAGKPSKFAIEYYVPAPGGAYMIEPFAPPGVKEKIIGLRDVFDD